MAPADGTNARRGHTRRATGGEGRWEEFCLAAYPYG